MCCGAIINSRIERVIFGAFDSKSGSVESIINMFDLPFNHKPKIVSGIMQKECSEILSDFFTELRKGLKIKNPDFTRSGFRLNYSGFLLKAALI